MNASVQESAVREVVDAVAAGDPAAARLVLHPYLHWTEGGVTIRGRSNVLRLLTARMSLSAPARVELRDGQIYRWVADE